MANKKRVFDKELGVELVLDDLDEKPEDNGGRKRPKFDSNQQTTSTTNTITTPTTNINTTKPSILSRLGDYATNVTNVTLKTPITDHNTESKNSGDDDLGSDENYEDIDYGEDDEDDDEDDDDFNNDDSSDHQQVGSGQQDLRSRIGRNNNYGTITDSNNDCEHENKQNVPNENADEELDYSGDMDVASREDDRDSSEGKDGEKGSSERCKYWPSCKSGDECTFYHPNKPCRAFPNCRYGQKCLYAHPPCKYNPHCTRPGCQFAHPLKSSRLPGPSSFVPAPQPLAPKCRYGYDCSNLMCKFSHQRAEPCRFGANCLLESCAFTHPSDVSRQKPTSVFKWSAQQ